MLKLDKIYANMATMPNRLANLPIVINSIIDQVHHLNVYLNGFSSVPDCLNNRKISFEMSKDIGDAGKFFWSDKVKGYYFTIDDDIIYPPDYGSTLVDGIEKRQRKAVVGMHGDIYGDHIKHFGCFIRSVHFRNEVRQDTPVCILGTGVCAYHTNTLKLSPDFFLKPNIADIWFTIACTRQGIPRIVLAHHAGKMQSLPTPTNLWDTLIANKAAMLEQAKLIQECLPWKNIKDVI